jgi:hypothetical protein
VLKLKIISFFLSLLIAVQMLPMQQIGKALAINQWTEELPHDNDEAGKDTSVKFKNSLIPHTYYSANVSIAFEAKALAYIHFSEGIPSNHSTEVVTPPPDSVS